MSVCSAFVNNKYQKLREEAASQLDELLDDINQLKSEHTTPEGFKKAVSKYLKQTQEESLLNERESLRQIAKREHNIKRMMDSGYRNNYAEGLASLLRTTNRNVKEGNVSVESIQNTFTKKYNNILEQNLTEAELKVLASKALDKDIIRYVASGGKAQVSEQVKKVGDLFRKFQDQIHADKKNSGIEINYLKDYAFNQKDIYNNSKMIEMGKEAWVAMVHSKLDIERTFPLMVKKEDQIKYLEDVYQGFIDRAKDAEAVDFNNLPKELVRSSIQRKNLKARQLHFTPEGLVDMWGEFSDKSLIESMVADGARAARDIGIYEVLGPNGQNEFDTLQQKILRDLKDQISKESNPKNKEKLQGQIDDIEGRNKGSALNFEGDYKTLWAHINGKVDQLDTKGKGINNFGENIRALSSMQVLGLSTLTAITDIFNAVSALNMKTGQGYFKSMWDVGHGLIKTLPPGEQRKMASQLNIAIEGGMGSILKGYSAEGAISKSINKMNYFYSKINPIAQQGRFHRTAGTIMFSMHLADKTLNQTWDKLDDSLKNTFDQAGIKEADFESFKALRQEVKDGQSIITANAINNITDDMAIKAIDAKKSDPNFWPRKPEEYRAYLEKRVNAMYDDFANFAAPNPGLRERAFLHGSTQKGTWGGEFVRTLAMLKSFTVKQASIMQKIYYNSPTKAGKIQHLSAQTLGLMSMGYVVLSLRALINNESPPDPTSPETIKKSFLTSGAGGVLADFLLNESERGAGPTVGFIGGPVFSKVDEAIKLAKKTASGEFKTKDLGKLSEFIPGNNIHVIKAAMAYTILDDFKEAASPGHKERMRKRRKEAEGLIWQPQKILK